MKLKRMAIAVCLFIVAGCAHQEDVVILDRRLSQVEAYSKKLDRRTDVLEDRLTGLLDQYAAKGAELEAGENRFMTALSRSESERKQEDREIRQAYAAVKATLDALADELQKLGGRLEESEYRIGQRIESTEKTVAHNRQTLDKLSAEVRRAAQELKSIARYLNLEEGGAQKTTPEAAPAAAPETDNALYAAAKKAFDEERFDPARTGFEKLIEAFPDSPHADNAQFWIGEIFYREGWYEKAILEYQKVIENHPDGNKVPAALLKQGFSFAALGDSANARLILEELVKQHPGTNEGRIAARKLKELNES